MSRWPLKQTLYRGEVPVSVFGWAIVDSETMNNPESIRRVESRLEIYAPAGTFPEGVVITLPDGTDWQLDGGARSYDHNPWWSPGLAVYVADRVTG